MSLANAPSTNKQVKGRCCRLHINSLWSVWYGLTVTALQAFLTESSARRFLTVASLPFNQLLPQLELYVCAALIAAAALLMPFFLLAAILKVDNLANDGFKLGRNLSTCTAEPPSVIPGNKVRGTCHSLWRHGGPTSSFLHLTSAFCLLLPRLLLEARLIQTGLLSKEMVWRTDLDLVVEHRDRLVVLNFFTNQPAVGNSTQMPTPSPFISSFNEIDELAYPQQMQAIIGSFGNNTGKSMSIEFANYASALVVYAVRYPAVFWNTNKAFGIIFSLQLLGNAIHALMSYAGVSVLYKIQVLGAAEALPALRRTYTLGSPFLLDGYVTLALFILSSALVLSSSLVLYLYGLGRFQAFLQTERERRVIDLRGNSRGTWGYLTHCAALCVLLSLAVCLAPLLHDYTVVYRSSLDGAVLATVLTNIFYLFLWVSVWLVLTLKQNWEFRLRVTVGRAAVRSARSVQLLTDVELVSNSNDAAAPLLVVGSGRTYTVSDISPKKAIMGVIQKVAMERKAKLISQGEATVDDDADIYWLRPKRRSPEYSSDSTNGKWPKRQSPSHKPKVTFNETTCKEMIEENNVQFEDDGDYATLRMAIVPELTREDTVSEDIKVLERVQQDENVTFVRSREPQPDYDDPNSVPDSKNGTPRCLRRADSGMQDPMTPRSGSVSSGSAGSGSSPPGAQSSESSSGVHSGGSSRRATSVDDLSGVLDKPQWRSCSLQRNVQPPGATGFGQPYSFAPLPHTEQVSTTMSSMMPAVILEHPGDDTVVIRRKGARPRTAELAHAPDLDDPFGRSTNMRMTSFTDETGSATLPHFPTQAPSTSPYSCNTMPHLPAVANANTPAANSFSINTVIQQAPRIHSTIPTHLNGVRIFTAPPLTAPYAKRLQVRLPRTERDSANYSFPSSGESDIQS